MKLSIKSPLWGFWYDKGRCVMETSENDKITPERAVEILKKGGMEVTLDQAKLMLEFLYKLADITVAQYVGKNKLS